MTDAPMQHDTTAYAPSPVGLEPGVAWDEQHPCDHCRRPAWAHGENDGACPPKDDELAQPGHGGIRGMRPLRPVDELDDLDRARMVELWRDALRASTDFERGYAQGRFEEYASQNAIDPDLFPALRYEAARQLDEKEGN